MRRPLQHIEISASEGPLQFKLLARVSAFRQIQVDEILVGYPSLACQCLEVAVRPRRTPSVS